ncbi:unnamed protein product [Microthlaspi erraticum]|uniref:Uncharacterized protein n=1 Tax=Microthlaspi erraticum TaxID=1685480 RepID=A0A6D2L1H6_9BRAS|nr:unnamed protein product [Microthlaspi erraticum]
MIGRRCLSIRLLSSSFYSSRISYDPPPRISPRAANDPVPTWSLIELELVFTSTGIARMAVNWPTRESLGGLEVFLLGLSGPGLQSWIKVMGPYGLDSSGTRNMGIQLHRFELIGYVVILHLF